MITLEELLAKINAFIATSDEQRRVNLVKLFEEFKKKYEGGTVPPVVTPEIKATEEGISGLKAFKIENIEPADAVAAIDGKKSTAFEGLSLTADLGGLGDVYGLAIKFKGGPYDYKVEASLDGTKFAEVPVLATTFKQNEFDIFEFGTPLITKKLRISSASNIGITTLEVLGEIKDDPEVPVPKPQTCPPNMHWDAAQNKCVDDTTTPPPPQPVGGVDEFGIKLLATPKPNGKVITEMGYKRSSHNTGTRDTFSKKGADATAMQVIGYYNTSLSDNDEELSYKVFGGTHSSSAPPQGQCYSFGMEQNGGPSMKKEYPEHPTTPDFSNDMDFEPGMPKKLQSIKDRWVGLGGLIWADQATKKVHIKVYVDDKGMVNGKPANDWKLWYTFTDDGKTMKGPAFMENMGVKNGGDAIFYMRIDTVTKKTDTFGVSCREIVPPTS